MELHTDPLRMPAVASATVVLVRDGAAGLEAFLLERNANSDVLGGAYVFPGGKLDPADVQLSAALDRSAVQLQAALGDRELSATDAAALHVAAIRELFEETGVLLSPCGAAEVERLWHALRGGLRFEAVVERANAPLLASCLTPWSRWITPVAGGVVRKRFDTRFFVAAVPAGQHPTHDDHEATGSLWLTPREALSRYWGREIDLAPPQIMTLAHLSHCATVDAAITAARSRPPPRILPATFEHSGARMMCYPGDPRHPDGKRAMPGPTRLAWTGGRFEPEGGFEGFFT